jgi:hypothetical protein
VGGALLETLTTGLLILRGTNTTDTSFPSRIPTITEPTGLGDAAAQTTSAVIPLTPGNGASLGSTQSNRALIIPFGAGADDTTFDMRVYGWFSVKGRTGGDNASKRLWIPVLLGEFNCTLSTQVGVANSWLATTDRLCDTIAIASTSANQGVSIDVVSDANNTGAHLVIDLKAAQKLEVTFDMTGATNANALVGFY